ncbi:hypothetical protein CEUSTIGMA_g11715.t1 [Chlamydomonas eustigma]|uniref:Saposin B-type domain-containing protein n=1 Tax=Chlamydomonas eustigma TaxID=1157962 RepID=A0A250XMP3_9CHLO|nr:hypothetical protein CEUSTIGMA_g11715.t1 [Chlamydomonas eustigma]|eukprot:GAX84293.1 hypothetical protein CEUSTIGMA_g11715.t1 [Chlamydomonas eustigma]
MKFVITLFALGLFVLARGAYIRDSIRQTPESCNVCLRAVRVLDNSITDTSMDAMVSLVGNNICTALAVGKKVDTCRSMSSLLLPAFSRWFKAAASPAHLCSAPSACGLKLQSTPHHNQVLQRVSGGGPLCALCSFVMDQMKIALNSTSVQQTIMEKAQEICHSLPADIGTSCIDFVQTYEPLVTQFIESVDSAQMCLLIGACLDGAVLKAPPPLPDSVIRALAALPDVNAMYTGAANDACDVCKMAVIEAHSLVTNPTVQSDLVNYTKALCDLVGGSALSETCREYVDTYAIEVFKLMDKLLTPDQLCTQLGICKPSFIYLIKEQAQEAAAKMGNVLSFSVLKQE